jgi:hypothetical protein
MDFVSKDKHIVIHPECGPAGVTTTNLAETNLQGLSRETHANEIIRTCLKNEPAEVDHWCAVALQTQMCKCQIHLLFHMDCQVELDLHQNQHARTKNLTGVQFVLWDGRPAF